jgi:deazaflavin-dependent oxidoreductase (nitroreductase family)
MCSMLDDAVRHALEIGPDAGLEDRTIDITTLGRRSGEPRRIEIVFSRVADTIYLTGIPAERPRGWLLNLAAHPGFTFHLKHRVVADLPATARVITDPDERRRVLAPVVEAFNARRTPDSPWPVGVLDDWVAHSPLAEVTFDDA